MRANGPYKLRPEIRKQMVCRTLTIMGCWTRRHRNIVKDSWSSIARRLSHVLLIKSSHASRAWNDPKTPGEAVHLRRRPVVIYYCAFAWKRSWYDRFLQLTLLSVLVAIGFIVFSLRQFDSLTLFGPWAWYWKVKCNAVLRTPFHQMLHLEDVRDFRAIEFVTLFLVPLWN